MITQRGGRCSMTQQIYQIQKKLKEGKSKGTKLSIKLMIGNTIQRNKAIHTCGR